MNFDDDFSALPVKAGAGVQIVKLGEDAQSARDPKEIASLVLSRSGWKETRDELRLRFVEIAVSHIKDIRDEPETREQFLKPVEKGGLGMSPVEVEATLDAFKEVMSLKPREPVVLKNKSGITDHGTRITEQGTAKGKLPTSGAEVAPPAAPAAGLPGSTRETLQKAARLLGAPAGNTDHGTRTTEQKTVEPVKQTTLPVSSGETSDVPRTSDVVSAAPAVPGADAVPAAVPLPQSREEAIIMLTNEVMNEAGIRFPGEYQDDRLRNAVSSRLREIRDWPETEETLSKPLNAGGVGLRPEAVAKIKASLEPRVARIDAELYKKEKQQTLEALKNERQAEAGRKTARGVAETRELDELYRQVTGKKSGPQNTDHGTRITEHGTGVADHGSRITEQRPAARPALAKPALAPLAKAPTPAAGRPEAPKAPTAAVKTAPAPGPAPAPTMTDVQAVNRLVGPIEELRRLSLSDFHKLAADPAEAARKIQDKLKLLEEDSFAKKFDGIAALKESELISIYFALARASLMKGVSIEEAIAGRAAENLPGLTIAEFNAIMELNKAMRF